MLTNGTQINNGLSLIIAFVWSLRVFVVAGLAGVYHIGDHYEFETWRGVEDVSTMCKAMYGPEHFDRFSPLHIVNSLPENTRYAAAVGCIEASVQVWCS